MKKLFTLLTVFLTAVSSAFAETKTVSTEAELTTAVSNVVEGDIIQLTADIDLTATIEITSTTPAFTLDLNDKTLKAGESYSGHLITFNGGTLTIQNGTLSGAKNSAIYCNASGLTLDHLTITGNTADYGGAIYGTKSAAMLLKDCVLSANTATNSGGAIYMNGGGADNPQDKCILVRTKIQNNTAGTYGGGVYFHKVAECLAAGTLVRMADGTEKPIEEVAEGDLVKTFDHESGTNSTAAVYIAYKGEQEATPFTLTFSSQATTLNPQATPLTLSIAGCHDLLEKESLKYVTITETNAQSFIGKKFYGEDGAWHELTAVTKAAAPCQYYSVYTAQHQNVYANGLLTVPDDADYLLNIYELDESLKADAAQLAADIAQYGIYTYVEVPAKFNITEEYFDASSMKYVNIVMGKGLRTYDEMVAIYGTLDNSSKAKGRIAVPSLTSSATDPTLSDASTGVLTLGENVIITNNLANSKASNIYLDHPSNSNWSLIALATNHSGISAGVSTSSGLGKFTTTDNITSADAGLFTSDDTGYTVFYNSNGYLELGYSFDESEVTKADLTAAKDKATSATVLIKRTFYKDGGNNTICLPFALDETALAASPLAGYSKLQEFSSATIKNKGLENETLELTMTDATAIEAGKPYIIAWESGDNLVNPVFESVTVTADEAGTSSTVGGVTFCGTLVPYAVEANNKGVMFVGTGGQLNWPNVGGNINGFRSYFTVDQSAGARFGMNAWLVDGEATGISDLGANAGIDSARAKKLIEAGKVVIVSNGKRYNMSGQEIK